MRGISRLLAGLALFAILAMAACEGDSLEPTAPPLQTPQLAPTPLVIGVSTPTPIPTNTPTPTPTPPPAAEILRRTTSAMEAVHSVHIEMDTSSALEGENGFTADIQLSGDFQLPDRTQATMSVKSQGFTIELEFIAIGEESYIKNPLTGDWEATVDAGESLGSALAAPAFETDFPSDKAAQFELVGIESLDGDNVYYLRSEIDGPDLAELMDDQSVYTAGGELAYWIGVDDYLIRKIEIRAEQESDGIGINAGVDTITAHFVIELSNYNQDVEIVAPEVEAPWWEGLDDTTGSDDSTVPVTIGEEVGASLDVAFEEDYYEFQVEEGAGYRISVTLDTLPLAELVLFDFEGNDIGWGLVSDDGTDEPIVLEESFAGVHYIIVSNYEGETGSYTLTITSLDEEEG